MPVLPVAFPDVTTGTGCIARDMVRLAELEGPPVFVAMIPTVKLPETLGVPLMNPVAAFNTSPAGRVPLPMA